MQLLQPVKVTTAAIILIICAVFTSCNFADNPSSSTTSQTQIDTGQIGRVALSLPDSLFALKDIKNTLISKYIHCDESDDCWYEGDGKKLRLVKLDNHQKMELIASCPGLNSNNGTEWIMGDWQVRFVSRQRPIGDFSPIIVSAGGTDFGGLLFIVLDKGNSPLSYLLLHGGECGEQFCGIRHSFFQRDSITTYSIKIVSNDTENTAVVDSITYLSRILPTGGIQTNRIDSSRYSRTIREDEFE